MRVLSVHSLVRSWSIAHYCQTAKFKPKSNLTSINAPTQRSRLILPCIRPCFICLQLSLKIVLTFALDSRRVSNYWRNRPCFFTAMGLTQTFSQFSVTYMLLADIATLRPGSFRTRIFWSGSASYWPEAFWTGSAMTSNDANSDAVA